MGPSEAVAGVPPVHWPRSERRTLRPQPSLVRLLLSFGGVVPVASTAFGGRSQCRRRPVVLRACSGSLAQFPFVFFWIDSGSMSWVGDASGKLLGWFAWSLASGRWFSERTGRAMMGLLPKHAGPELPGLSIDIGPGGRCSLTDWPLSSVLRSDATKHRLCFGRVKPVRGSGLWTLDRHSHAQKMCSELVGASSPTPRPGGGEAGGGRKMFGKGSELVGALPHPSPGGKSECAEFVRKPFGVGRCSLPRGGQSARCG